MARRERTMKDLSDKEQAKYGLSILILIFPTLIVAIIALVVSSVFVAVGVIALLLMFQFVLIKNFMDDYYFV